VGERRQLGTPWNGPSLQLPEVGQRFKKTGRDETGPDNLRANKEGEFDRKSLLRGKLIMRVAHSPTSGSGILRSREEGGASIGGGGKPVAGSREAILGEGAGVRPGGRTLEGASRLPRRPSAPPKNRSFTKKRTRRGEALSHLGKIRSTCSGKNESCWSARDGGVAFGLAPKTPGSALKEKYAAYVREKGRSL